jgi:O-acetyl-ADP-ribose deacetylase (regulator of RNase III)
MPSLVIKHGDLLEASEEFIAHQCNCTSRGARGLAKAIFARLPDSNVYLERDRHSEMGTIAVRGRVIAMFAQRSPGYPKDSGGDTLTARVRAFKSCLKEIATIQPKPRSIAFPYLIGCGLAGGKWGSYLEAIEIFAEESGIRVTLYNL